MTLIKSKQKPEYKWHKGDLISAREACELLGYKSSAQLTHIDRINSLEREFEAVSCRLTVGIRVGGQRRYLRSEIDAFLTKIVENAQKFQDKTNKILRR